MNRKILSLLFATIFISHTMLFAQATMGNRSNSETDSKPGQTATLGARIREASSGSSAIQHNMLTANEVKDGWKLLYNGQNFDGWRGAGMKQFPTKGWHITADHSLEVEGAEGKEAANGGDIVTLDNYSFFDLKFDFKYSPGANSGVKYFVTESYKTSGSAIGLEYQILDDQLHPDAKLGRDGNRTLSSLYDLIPANKDKKVEIATEWNSGRILVNGSHVEHWLNGYKVLEYERGSEAFRDLVKISKYRDFPDFGESKAGHILLQDHGGKVDFRDIKIKLLKAPVN